MQGEIACVSLCVILIQSPPCPADLMESSLSHAIEGKSALSEFVCDANEALRFRLVRNPEDASTEATEEDFAPEMCHQVYGEQ